jgi:hypothetical protein
MYSVPLNKRLLLPKVSVFSAEKDKKGAKMARKRNNLLNMA